MLQTKINRNNYILFSLFLLYSFLLFFFCSKFSPLYDFNEWPDVNIYYTIGKGVFFNKVIYKDLFDHKGPIIFFIYALGYALSPNGFLGLFLIEGFLFSVALFFIYLTAKLFINNSLSFCVALAFPLAFFSFSSTGGSPEEFIVIVQIISFYFFIKYFVRNSIKYPLNVMFLQGVLCGIVFFIKLNLVLFFLVPLLLVFINIVNSKLYGVLFKTLISFILGFLTIFSIFLLYFAFNSAIYEFWDAYIVFNSYYGSLQTDSFFQSFTILIFRFYNLLLGAYFELVVFLFGLIFFLFCPIFKQKMGKYLLPFTLLITLLIIFSGKMFIEYYYISISVFTIPGLISIAYFFNKYFSVKSVYSSLIVTLFCFISLCFQKNFFGFSINNLIQRNFPKTMESVLSDEIMKTSNPTLLSLGIGVNGGLNCFTLAKIVPNVRFFFRPNNINEGSEYYFLVKEQISYIRSRLIDFVIVIDADPEFPIYKKALIESGYGVVEEADNGRFNFLLFKKN